MSHRAQSVVIDGNEYASIQLAADALGLMADTVRRRVNSTLSTWAGWTRKGKTKAEAPSRARRKVSIKGNVYDSVQAAAKALGLTHNTVYARITSDSVEFREYQFLDIHPTRVSHRTRHVKVVVNGERFDNLRSAASAQGVTRHGLRNRMRQGGQVNYINTVTGEIIA